MLTKDLMKDVKFSQSNHKGVEAPKKNRVRKIHPHIFGSFLFLSSFSFLALEQCSLDKITILLVVSTCGLSFIQEPKFLRKLFLNNFRLIFLLVGFTTNQISVTILIKSELTIFEGGRTYPFFCKDTLSKPPKVLSKFSK